MADTFGVEDLRRIMRECLGVTESLDLGGEALDTSFGDLGYDSLAVLELAARIGNEYGIAVPDADMDGFNSPRAVLEYVNRARGTAGESAARTENEILIEAPFDLVWTMTNDVASWPELFSEYAKAEILAEEGEWVRFRLHTHPDENGKVWDWVSERHLDRANRTVRAERVSPGPFEHMRIKWDYTPVEGRGVLMRWVQEFHLKPEAPVDDAFMAARINRNSVEQLSRIKQRVEAAAARREPVR